MDMDTAVRIATDLHDWMAPLCLRSMVVGSCRRRNKPETKDLEILVMPKAGAPRPEFGKPAYRTALDQLLAQLEKEGTLHKTKGAEVYRQYQIRTRVWGVESLNPFKLDLYLVESPYTWGVQAVIRTGPEDFSHWCVTNRRKGGALPDNLKVKDHWHVLDGDSVLPMPEEIDFLRVLGLGWTEPKDRKAEWHKFDKRS
jgi:DNA polymerase/3'-5' exonuclease PolX